MHEVEVGDLEELRGRPALRQRLPAPEALSNGMHGNCWFSAHLFYLVFGAKVDRLHNLPDTLSACLAFRRNAVGCRRGVRMSFSRAALIRRPVFVGGVENFDGCPRTYVDNLDRGEKCLEQSTYM